MRLLIISQYFWPENFRVNELAVEMAGRGHEVTVLTGYPNYPDGEIFKEFRADPSAFAKLEGLEIVRVALVPRGQGSLRLILNYFSFAASALIMGAWKLRGRKFDQIFVFEPSPITVGLPAVFLRFVKKAPLTFWVLDLWPETLQALGVVKARPALKLIGVMVKFIYKRCDLILAQSRSFIGSIRAYAGENSRIRYFPSWSEKQSGEISVLPAAEVPPVPGSFSVMFAGNIGEAQDFPAILAAAEILKSRSNIRWLIVGDGRKAAWVAQEIKQQGLENSVFLLGRYPPDRMPSFFKHADALLVSLKDEQIFSMTIPGKLQSYLSAGVPVIAMLNGEGSDIVRRSQAGLTCAAGDAQGLSNAVLELSEMALPQRRQMGQNGVAVSEQEFDRGRLIDQLEQWMNELAGPSSAAVKP